MRALAVVTVIASVALAMATTALAWLSRDTPVPDSLYMGSKVDISAPIGTLVFVATGAVIALRQPRHPVAWCFLLLGLLGDLFLAFAYYGLYGTLTAPGRLPAAEVAMWLAHWFWAIPSSVLPIMLLLFPDGRPPSVRWWPLAWLAVGTTLLFAIGDALSAWYSEASLPLESPPGTPILLEALGWASLLGALMYTVTLVGAGVSLVVRFRRSRGAERQQLKWFGCAAAVVVSSQLLGLLPYVAPVSPVLGVLSGLSFALLPVSAAVAILRYRLYDIDLLINRTLVYAATSTAIAVTFFIGIVGLQALLRPLTAGSELAIAASTLMSFALFQPVRGRVQKTVDRRFDRSRYDAARTLDAFADRLRDEVNLDALREDLLVSVQQTMGPAHMSLWLRGRAS